MVAFRKTLLTTSRNPTSRIRTFCHDLSRVIPGVVRVNRGKMSMDEVAEKALEYGVYRVVIVDRWNGEACKIGLFQVGASGLISVPPAIYVARIRLQREFEHSRFTPTRSLAITLSSKGNDRVTEVASSLSKFLNFPAFLANEKPSKYTMEMRVSCDVARRVQITFVKARNFEVGPRITLSQMMRGTGK